MAFDFRFSICGAGLSMSSHTWVIPNHVNKKVHMTISELDETWYAGSTFGFVLPDKISLSYCFLVMANEKFLR